jgi:predicted AAA+ superfamily ATPase
MNTALMSAQSHLTMKETRGERDVWGRLVESAVGAHLVNNAAGKSINVFYWRETIREVDYILQRGKAVTAIEVKSGRKRESLAGVEAFASAFRPQRNILVGEGGIPLERFLTAPVEEWIE